MNGDREPNRNFTLDILFQQTINERKEKYEERIDNSFECFISKFKYKDNVVPKFNGDCNLDEFSVAAKVITDRENFQREFRSDLAELITDSNVIGSSKELIMSHIASSQCDELNDKSEDDLLEVAQNFDVEESTSSDGDLICENEANEKICDEKEINLKKISDLLIEKESTSDTESVSSFVFDEDKLNSEISKIVVEKLNKSTNARDRKNAALAFSNFMVDKRLLTFEKRLSEEELNSLYDMYVTETNPEVSISYPVLDVLREFDIVKDEPLPHLNNNEVEFKETFFLNRIQEMKIRPNEQELPFKGEISRILNPGYLTRLTKFRCSFCKDCFSAQDEFDVHNVSEKHILGNIYFRDRAWFKKDVDYLQINGIPDLTVNRDEAVTCEISCVNIAQNGSKIYVCKIFELVYPSVGMRIEYGSNFCLEKGDSFKINMRVSYSSIVISETLHPIVMKIFRDDIDEYNYILIEPHFKVERRSMFPPRNTLPPPLKNYRPPLRAQDQCNNKRCIIAETYEHRRQIISDKFGAFNSDIKKHRATLTPKTSNKSFHRTENTETCEILKAPRIARAIAVPKMNLQENSIPPFLRSLIKSRFKTANFQWSLIEKQLLRNVKKLICEEGTMRLQHNKDALSDRNYIQRLHNMMWIEEYHALEEIRSYGQMDVNLLTDRLNENLVGITLPNLSEGRPSLLKGDFITITVKLSSLEKRFIKFQGSVQIIEEKAAYAKLHKTFYAEKYWRYKADVEFRFNRTSLKMSHAALNNIYGMRWQESLFPRTFDQNPNCIQLRPFFNESINQNELQIQAIKNIVQNRAFPAPYILFGPPGTGKTATLVESIVQIWSTMESSKICVCASSNTAADVIAKRLLQYIPLTEIVRIYGLSRNDAEIISELQGCCNYDSKVKEVYFPCPNELKRKRIVVMTPVTAGRFILNGITFDYIFMDEAGHALEVDVLIPFSGFLRNAQCGLVLAGDPQQLGPVVRSPYAIALGYGMSLLERLMTQCNIYKKDPITGKYNPKVITKLVNNYRSHDLILSIPNERFYENELQATAPKDMIYSLCQWNCLPAKGFPIIFHSVKGKEERENNSPSYFNSSEVDVVAKYVKDLFHSKDVRLEQSEIGIISPYRKQVQKIRQRLLQSWPKINVASVEEFQGQERKVIIISTVRSRHESLATDYKYGLGFLKNEKRFNVAITRAIALLIVIGNPDILQCDPHWRAFLNYCAKNSAFVGEPADGVVPDDFDPNINGDMYLSGFHI